MTYDLQQAWYLTEAMEAVAPGLCLGALSKVPIEIYKFLIEVPFAKEKSPCPFKYEVSGLLQSMPCNSNECDTIQNKGTCRYTLVYHILCSMF